MARRESERPVAELTHVLAMGRANGHSRSVVCLGRRDEVEEGAGFAGLDAGQSTSAATASPDDGAPSLEHGFGSTGAVARQRTLDETVIVPLYRLQRDPAMSAHFGRRLRALDDLNEEEFEALREYARQAEAAVREAEREHELDAALSAVASAVGTMRQPLNGRCRHCWAALAATPGLSPSARYDSENCRRAARNAAQRRARLGANSIWGRDNGLGAADETLYVIDQVARMAALGVVAGDILGQSAARLAAPLRGALGS